jgi:hypothetical protein
MESFVLRLWRPQANDGAAGLRGLVRRVGTGEERVFASIEELVAFLQAEPSVPEPPPRR